MFKRSKMKATERMMQRHAAGRAIRTYMPYGMLRDEISGKVVFFNREYEVMNFGGQKEFDLDPEELDIDFVYSAEGKFLMGEDGSVYVGWVYLLYNSENAPYYLDGQFLVEYLMNYNKLAEYTIHPIGNAYNNCTATTSQYEKMHKALRKYFS